VLLAVLAGCGPRGPAGGAPPRGKTLDQYLDGGGPAAPARPADLDPSHAMVLHVIDIGQGLALLLEFPCGAALIDTGGEEDREWDGVSALRIYLDEFFRRRTDLDHTLDLLAITHPHIDHTRGIDMVLGRYTVRNVIDNGMHNDDEGGQPQNRLHEWLKAHAATVDHRDIHADDIGPTGMTDGIIDPINGCKREITDPQIRALWGQVVAGRDQYSDNPNDHSVALRVGFGKASLLIPGDLEERGSSRLDEHYRDHPELLDVDVWVVGHHGSRNATHRYMLEHMTPELAVISAGPYERDEPWTARAYGHPNKVALDKLVDPAFGVRRRRTPIEPWVGIKGAWADRPSQFARMRIDRAVYCTCWDGSVRVRRYPSGWIEVEGERQPPPAP